MGRNKALTRGRALPALVAGTIGYLIGGWHPAAVQSQSLSATESVALRFPQQWDTASPVAAAADALPAVGVVEASATTATGMDDPQFALLSPEPMVPQAVHQGAAQPPQPPVPEAAVELASAEDVSSPSAFYASETRKAVPLPAVAVKPVHSTRAAVVPAAPARASRAPAIAAHRPAMDRPGYMLDDAQIASIKERLHLTPDQEQMWPAVEAALRNIAYTRAQQARRRGVPAGSIQTADVDPESVEGLKSAAVPLIMSFNDEQKQEVRNLAHVMGLDQLASEF